MNTECNIIFPCFFPKYLCRFVRYSDASATLIFVSIKTYAAKYGETVDPVAAYEKLEQKATAAEQGQVDAEEAARQADQAREESREQARGGAGSAAGGAGGGDGRGGDDDEGFIAKSLSNPAVRSFMRSAASAAGREITRSLFGTRRRRR